jgi:hypothetical protein
MTNAAAWGKNASSTDHLATFNYDYSANGIPEAPNSRSGDSATRGVKLEANIVTPAAAAVFTLYPLDQNFTGSHRLRFDAWMNFDVQEALGGAVGTTEFLGGGVGYDIVTADVASGAQAITTGDGGAASDWRAFKSPPQFIITAANMAGGSNQNSVAYYTSFLPGVQPPAAQGLSALAGASGAPGFQWITWEFTAINGGGNNTVTVHVEKPGGDRLRIVTIDCTNISDGSSGCTSEGNISLFYGDFFTSVSPRPDLTFGVIDNVVVNRVLFGDYNGDGIVDAADFTVWRDHLGQAIALTNESLTPGMVTIEDYDEWKSHFGLTAGTGSGSFANTAVPEPTSGALFLALTAWAMLTRPRRESMPPGT